VTSATSSDATEALRVLLGSLPVTTPDLVIVQHIPQPFSQAFAARLNSVLACFLSDGTEKNVDAGAVAAHRRTVEQSYDYEVPLRRMVMCRSPGAMSARARPCSMVWPSLASATSIAEQPRTLRKRQ
jgi:hypothetical protein